MNSDAWHKNFSTISAKDLLERYARQFEAWLEKEIAQCPFYVQPEIRAVIALCSKYQAKDLLEIIQHVQKLQLYLAGDRIASIFLPGTYLGDVLSQKFLCYSPHDTIAEAYASLALTLANFLYSEK